MYLLFNLQKHRYLHVAVMFVLGLSACSKSPEATIHTDANMPKLTPAQNTHTSQVPVPKIPVKVVVVSMFENGEVRGDRPGEFQLWVEGRQLDTTYDFPLGEYALRMDDNGVLGICVGGGIPNATASIMALGLDPRFDLSQAYWLVAGIAGADPADMSLGSAAWVTHVVDGDLVYEIDAREIPEAWPYGLIPLGGKEPADTPDDIYTGWTLDTIHFKLNADLANWAFEETKSLVLEDGKDIAEFRKQFSDYPNAMRPPFVTMGETLSASTYWHGKHLNQWANDWVKLYAGDQANFMTSNMEDSGTLTALARLNREKRVDLNRVMILRTASNFTVAPTQKSSTWSATAPYPDEGLPAIKSAFTVGNTVVEKIVNNWSIYQTRIPGDNK